MGEHLGQYKNGAIGGREQKTRHPESRAETFSGFPGERRKAAGRLFPLTSRVQPQRFLTRHCIAGL